MKTLRSATIASVIVAVAGCADVPTDSVPTSAAWVFEETWRKDGMADPDVPLTRITSVNINGTGEIFLTDVALKSVLRLSPEGDLLQTIGRGGEGPGEFASPYAVGFLDESIWVGDPFGGAIEVFDRSGHPLQTITVSHQGSTADDLTLVPRQLLADGRVLLTPPGVSPTGVLSGRSTHQSLVAIEQDGSGSVELARVPLHVRDFVQFDGGMSINPIQSSPLFAVKRLGTGIVVATRELPTSAAESTYSVHHIDQVGDTTWSVTRAYTPLPVAEGYFDAWMEVRAPGSTTTDDPRLAEQLAAVRAVTALPDFHTPVTEVVAGADGSVWVVRELQPGEPVRWDVFAADGTFLAEATGPAGFRLLYADGDVLWGQALDEFDTPSLVRLDRTRAPA